jgi:hypothetical protein
MVTTSLGFNGNRFMGLFGSKSKTPEQVFTPRSAEVNEVMYISRPDLEEKLLQALQGRLHILIHGESGCGKSWLYKRVLSGQQACYLPANLAIASNLGSIASALKNAVDREGQATKTGYAEKKGAEVGLPGVAKGGLEHTGQYEIGEKEPFEACLSHCRAKAGSRPGFLVLDNLETIFSDDNLMKELGNLITVLDDNNYSKYNVRMIIVGVPSEVKEYFTKLPNRQTIANRLKEIPEVTALKHDQIADFVKRGFRQELAYIIANADFDLLVNHIEWVTLGVPQRLHEYCLELAYLAQKQGNTVAVGMLDAADGNWLEAQLSNDFSVIQSIMNERETKVGRRNQVLFVLGQITRAEFRNPDVEAIIRSEFPQSTANVTINVSQILSDLAGRPTPIIKKSSSKSDAYIFTDPRFKMCIRTMLRKDTTTEQISHLDIKDL